jgi:hypothetical protein
MSTYYSDVEHMEFFFRYADARVATPLLDDLDILLNYVTVCCWTTRREEEAIAAKKAELEAARCRARKEAKKSPCAVM